MANKTPENRIHLSYGPHTIEGVSSFEKLELDIAEHLANHDHKVAFFVEHAFLTSEFVNLFNVYQDRGYKPSESYVRVQLVADLQREATTREARQKLKTYLWDSPFEEAQFRMLDRLKEKFGQRFHIVLESNNRNLIDSQADSFGNIVASKHMDAFEDYLLSGNFHDAQREFRQSVKLRGQFVRRRDQNIARQMKFLSEEKNFSLVMGRFGSLHTGIQHELRNRGVKSTRTFDETKGSSVTFRAYEIMIRRESFGKTVDDPLIWLQASLAVAIEQVLDKLFAADETLEGESVDDSVRSIIYEVFSNEESINNFEQKVRKTDFVTALSDELDEY